MRRWFVRFAFLLLSAVLINPILALAQVSSTPDRHAALTSELAHLVSTPGVSGYEDQFAQKLRSKLEKFQPETDNLGDVIITIGSGSPRRLIVTPIDEPGFVVSQITNDGYLRLQRLPQSGLLPIFNELYSAQPVWVRTTGGKWIDGVVAGLSVHLQPGRANPAKPGDLEELYVDIGASSPEEVQNAGVAILSPVTINRSLIQMGGSKLAGASLGDRFGAAALMEMLAHINLERIRGTLTIAFVVQEQTGARGLERILTKQPADELTYVGRLLPGGPVSGSENLRRAPRREPGSGVLAGFAETSGSMAGLSAELKNLAESNRIRFQADYSANLLPRSYLPPPAPPAKWAQIGIPVAWPNTPAEMIDESDLESLEELLELYAQGRVADHAEQAAVNAEPRATPKPISQPPAPTEILERLVETYGVSDHEGPVREVISASMLPSWAKPETDAAGNLIVHVGTAAPGSKAPPLLVVAHMDEIGFQVKAISKDGRLEVAWKGGGELGFFAGHPAVIHTTTGDRGAIMELPEKWDTPGFAWPRDSDPFTIRVDAGARSPEEVEKLGIKTGDTITIPKQYRPLISTRANGRSFDDRVGCAALISALWTLGGPLKDRDVTFVFSTGEELGLNGAAALAERLASEGKTPGVVFAVDTFVSSDSPIESKRIADAPIGKGFVVRAVDNSNIVPMGLVQKVVSLARENKIPVQYGVTGGGNDGSEFVRYGAVDVALGWPLRYSHSPAEVIDTRDLDSLARIIAAIAKSW
jgi:putative aminopeptidase FrvX